ncbi:putative membrane protein [Salmonella phage polluks]|nr:hypothetical protein [Citrobacter portucalensis]YP_009858365.1 hypothetical protein HWD24_gp111 [Salmonella phage rokbiter]QIN93366.1 putative membrane protein [Salmonella phage vB_SenS-3]QIN99768.1 putative membrane protein [Salmonella phage vaffelhjerte]QIN99928.1 putative membrane protein [Salmonella phage misterkot]QIO00421.1 putative membrane protein [Salmonella phage polluks]WPJ70137.1 hypothetical protein orfRA40_00111c [Salmonella phage RA40]
MIIEILIGLLVLTTLAAIGGIIGILNASKNMEAMKATNNALWEKYIAAEKDIEDTQRRSDLLKEKLKNVETLVGNTKLPIKVLRAQVITEIKK